MNRETLLLVAASDHDANMLYAVGMFVPDPFIFVREAGRDWIVVSDLELDRARRQAEHCRVLPLSRYLRKLAGTGACPVDLSDVVTCVLRERQVRRVVVPQNFPLGLARKLEMGNVSVEIREGQFFPEREVKRNEEVKKISAALLMAEVGLSEGMQVLKRSRIGRDGRIYYHNAPLTSERLRAVIDTAITQTGGSPSQTIVAGGKQGCDPHERGYGPLRANQPIILDVFPRSQKTGYFGDISRTVVKGRASEAVRKMYGTVRRGQEIAFGMIRDGTAAASVHSTVSSFFRGQGYRTGKNTGRMQGFFHSLGHGLGLEIHEAPRLSGHSEDTLKTGNVITVEPGLYYADCGGVRLEDVALVGERKARVLTRFEKQLEL